MVHQCRLWQSGLMTGPIFGWKEKIWFISRIMIVFDNREREVTKKSVTAVVEIIQIWTTCKKWNTTVVKNIQIWTTCKRLLDSICVFRKMKERQVIRWLSQRYVYKMIKKSFLIANRSMKTTLKRTAEE